MVWFQCESCGEELKKPKLPNHFRQCPAYKLSCIDCGEMFDKQSVQFHTQCITETEKYGPKGQGNIATGKPIKEKPKLDVDINVGLSNRHPWFCSLCNTKATSQQALLLHADGKKHRAKVRAFTAKQKASEETVPENKDSVEINVKNGAPDSKSTKDTEENNVPSNGTSGHDNSSVENGNLPAKKRKSDTSNDNDSSEKCPTPKMLKKANQEPELKNEKLKDKRDTGNEGGKGEADTRKERSKEKVKWKKLIARVLKSDSKGSLKMKKLRKLVFKELRESGIAVDDTEYSTVLEQKVNSSSKFIVDGKYVRLAV